MRLVFKHGEELRNVNHLHFEDLTHNLEPHHNLFVRVAHEITSEDLDQVVLVSGQIRCARKNFCCRAMMALPYTSLLTELKQLIVRWSNQIFELSCSPEMQFATDAVCQRILDFLKVPTGD